MKYVVSYQQLTGRIVVGKLNAHGTAFLDKEDQTDRALRNVAEYVHHEYGGSMTVDFNDGTSFDIQVTKRTAEEAGDE